MVSEPRWPGVLGAWSPEPPVIAALLVAAVLYEAGSRAAGGVIPSRARLSFEAGLVVVAVALLSPVATYGEALLSVHMVQHLLLTFVAAPLLLLGRPLAACALLGRRRPGRPAQGGRSRPGSPDTAAVVRILTHPLVAWAQFAGVTWAIHFSPLFDEALQHPALHGIEHAVFLASALLFWWPVISALPTPGRRGLSYPMRLLYLALAMPQNTFLALAVFSTSTVLYEHYADLGRTWGPSAIADQRQGGGIMWVAGDLALLASVLLVAAAWARHEEGQDETGHPLSGAPAGRGPSPRTTT